MFIKGLRLSHIFRCPVLWDTLYICSIPAWPVTNLEIQRSKNSPKYRGKYQGKYRYYRGHTGVIPG